MKFQGRLIIILNLVSARIDNIVHRTMNAFDYRAARTL
jgi:hypothetical protein